MSIVPTISPMTDRRGHVFLPGTAGSASAFRSVGGSLEPFPRPGMHVGEAFFVLDRRLVAGQSITLQLGDAPLAGIWRQGVFQSLGSLPTRREIWCIAITACTTESTCGDESSGWMSAGRPSSSPSPAGSFGAAACSPASRSRGQFVEPDQINDQGVIAGVATDSTHLMHVVLWRPKSAAPLA